MSNHNEFVFDFQNKEFLANFEEMYQKNIEGTFDSWEQDSMSLYKKIDLSMVDKYNFETIIDLDYDKGYFTNLLKNVFGYDISKTAVDIAKSKFSNIDFTTLDINNIEVLSQYLNNKRGGTSMIISRATLYYLSEWGKVLNIIAKYSEYVLFGLNIPIKTIAFIKYEGRNSFSILGRSIIK